MTFVLERPISISTRRKLLPLADTVLPALNDKKVNLRVADNACVLTDTVGELYDNRHNKPKFQLLVESYNRALEAGDEPPCSKDPTRYSLYEFASMFDKQWGRLEPFKFVHVVPSIRRRPNKQTNPEFHRNFMLIIHPPRARVKEIPPPSGNHGQALDHRLLNPKQALAVECVRQKLERVITEDEQFFLEICGQAGTGKNEILKRILADLAVRLADSTTRSVGTMVRFAGAAAKLMPQPNSTIHSLVNAPIDFKNNL